MGILLFSLFQLGKRHLAITRGLNCRGTFKAAPEPLVAYQILFSPEQNSGMVEIEGGSFTQDVMVATVPEQGFEYCISIETV